MIKVFLDANILLDFLLKREGFEESKELVQWVVEKKVKAYITPSIVQILGYWLNKAYGPKLTKDLLLNLLNDVSVIDISHQEVVIAVMSNLQDIEDAIQYHTALYHKVQYFISRDKQLQKKSIPSLPVMDAAHFKKLLSL